MAISLPLDPQYIEQIKGFEGYRETPYWDYKQHTSGYGTKAANPDEVIDRATAERRLSESLAAAAAHVDSVNPNIPSGARAALISLTYNAGPGWAGSGLGELVRAGDWSGAKERFQQYNKAGGEVHPGLVNRRSKEAAWFDGQGAPQVARLTPPIAAPSAPAITTGAAPPIMNAPTAPPIFANQSAPQQSSPSYFGQMPAEQMQAPPIFAPPRKPIDLSKLRAALEASGNRGLSL